MRDNIINNIQFSSVQFSLVYLSLRKLVLHRCYTSQNAHWLTWNKNKNKKKKHTWLQTIIIILNIPGK